MELGIIVLLWPINPHLSVNPCKEPFPKDVCYYHIVTEAETKEILFCVYFTFNSILHCIFSLKWIVPLMWCMNPVTDRAVFIVNSLLSRLHNSLELYKTPQCFLIFSWTYPKAAHIPASTNPEHHWDEQAWPHIPPNWAPFCQCKIQESWSHIKLSSWSVSVCVLISSMRVWRQWSDFSVSQMTPIAPRSPM